VIRTFGQDTVLSLAFSPDGRHVVSTSGNALKLWEVATGREVGAFN
jgi:WD40 repeat protein